MSFFRERLKGGGGGGGGRRAGELHFLTVTFLFSALFSIKSSKKI